MSLLLIWQQQSSVTGSGGVTLQAPGVSGSGTETATATGAVAFAAPAVAASGLETITATGSVTLAAPSVSGTGSEGISGSGGIVLAAPAVSGTEEETFTGTGAVSFAAPAVAGSGSHASATTGSGAINDCGGAFDSDAFDSDAFDTGQPCLHISISGTGTVSGGVTPPPRRHGGKPLRAAGITGPAGRRRRRITGKGGIVIRAPHIAARGMHNDDELALLVLLGAYR